MPELSSQEKVQKLRIYIGESDRWRGKPLYSALLETFRSQQMAGVTVFRGLAGFGAHSRIRSASIEALSMDLPVVIEVVDYAEKITAVLDMINPMVREGLITLEEVQVIKYTHRLLNPLPVDRLVSEVMTRGVVSFSSEMPVHQVWQAMLDKQVKAAPIIDQDDKVIGILTDEDLLRRAGIQQRLSIAIRLDKAEIEREMKSLEKLTLRAKDVMTKPAITVLDTQSLGVATIRMVKAGLKRLPVVNKDGRLVGMLSRLDVLRQVANQPEVFKTASIPVRAFRVVGDVMMADIPMVKQEDDLVTLINKFAQSGSHRLIVVDQVGKAVGLISDSDVVSRMEPRKRRSILEALRRIGKPPEGTENAFDLMSPGVLTASPDLPVVEAAQMMLADARKWLVVIDEQEKPLGLVDRQALLNGITSNVDTMKGNFSSEK